MSNYRPAGYKPSYLEYTEMVLLALCYISHFMSWASLSINGSNVFSSKKAFENINGCRWAFYIDKDEF